MSRPGRGAIVVGDDPSAARELAERNRVQRSERLMGKLLTERQEESYRRDGIAYPLRVLSAEQVAPFRQASDRMEEALGGRPRTVEVRQMHLHFRWAFELVTAPRVLDAVEDILGPDILVWATELFAKHAHDENVSIGWHRDQPYMGFKPGTTTTAWISLGPSTVANGCMCVLLEEDRFAALQAETGPGSKPGRRPSIPEQDMTRIELEPGEMSLHDVGILHGSGPNLSGEKRVGFAVRYVSPQAQPLNGRPPAIRVRGSARPEHFTLVDPPSPDDPQTSLEAMKQSASSHLEAMLHNLKQS